MWEGEWKEGRPWKVGSLTCPSSANRQSQPAIWAAVGSCALTADAFTQPLSPNFIFQQTPAAAAAATLRGNNFPLKMPGLPLSADASMMAVEKQRSAFASRPERRDVAALLIAGASQASLVDDKASGSRMSPRLHRRRQPPPDTDPIISPQLPPRPASSNPALKTNALFKGRSEENFRLLAADSSIETRFDCSAIASVSSSQRLQRELDAADALNAKLKASVTTGAKPQTSSASVRPPSAAKIVSSKTSKGTQKRVIVEAWV